MAFKKKLKKVNKGLLIIYFFFSVFLLASLILLTVNLSYLKGIETFYRVLGLVFLYMILIFYLLYGFIWLFTKKTIKFSIYSVFIFLILALSVFGNYYINKTYRIIDSINKNEITYTSNLIILKDSKLDNIVDTKVGMISNEDDISGHILAKELIKRDSLKYTVVLYDDYYQMFDDLNDKEIDGLFISGNYTSLFIEEDIYSSIAKDTVVFKTISKTMKKQVISDSKKSLNEPFTLLLLGIDSTKNGLSKNDSFNGDSIMLITFNPKKLSATFLSIPRDSYVPIACRKGVKAKINSSAYSGTSCMIDTITDLTGIKIDFFVKMNFVGIVDLVNALGGIEVNVPYSLCEQDSQRRWGKHTIFVKEGLQRLNGEQALALSRNRHFPNDDGAGEMKTQCPTYNKGPRNDFVRGQNQQLVVQGLMNEVKSIRNVNSFYNLLNAVSGNMDTNIETGKMLSFYETAKNIVLTSLKKDGSIVKIEKLYLQTSNLHIHGIGSAEIVQKKSLDVIVKAMKVNLDIEKEELIKTFAFDVNTVYEIPLIGAKLYDGTKIETLPNFVGSNKSVAVTWTNNHKIALKINEITSDNPNYNPEVAPDVVIKQSIPAHSLLDNVKTLEITIQK